MRQMISGLVAAIAVVAASAVPAMACGGGLLAVRYAAPARRATFAGAGLFGLQHRLRRLGL